MGFQRQPREYYKTGTVRIDQLTLFQNCQNMISNEITLATDFFRAVARGAKGC